MTVREFEATECSFGDRFKGFETVGAVKRLFGSKTAKTLKGLLVKFTEATVYMRVDNSDGHVMINPRYFLEADDTDLYLDVIHELVHVKQLMEGRMSDESVEYVKRPLEIQAYRVTVNEARALGIDEEEILDYLDSDLVSGEQLRQLAVAVGIDYEYNSL